MAIKILIVDDHKMMREGLRALLEKQPDMEVVGEAGDGMTAIRLVHELGPDIVVMDVCMDGMDGIDATRRIVNETGNTRVVVLSMYLRNSFVRETLKAGALAYVLKEYAFTNLVDAIKSAMADKIYLCPEVASIAIDSYVHDHLKTDAPSNKILTNREREILKLLAEGKPSKEIALILNVSAKTIDASRRRVMQKLDIQSIAELVKYAIKEGLTSLDD